MVSKYFQTRMLQTFITLQKAGSVSQFLGCWVGLLSKIRSMFPATWDPLTGLWLVKGGVC